jgi:hypothetical protein
MENDPGSDLTPTERRGFRRLAGFMVPASATHGVPGADDETIFGDIDVRQALAMLGRIAGGDFASLDEVAAERAAMTLLGREGPATAALGRAVLQCYYRDERVLRALGLEPRAPFPLGYALEQGDWSLLDAVRGRPRMWRDIDGEAG